jgi:hypothetical protein
MPLVSNLRPSPGIWLRQFLNPIRIGYSVSPIHATFLRLLQQPRQRQLNSVGAIIVGEFLSLHQPCAINVRQQECRSLCCKWVAKNTSRTICLFGNFRVYVRRGNGHW